MPVKISVVIEQDKHGFYAYCPELKGCHSQGESLEEILQNIREAAELYLTTLSKQEVKDFLSKEILTTALQVNVA